jgi:hypothetical protein
LRDTQGAVRDNDVSNWVCCVSTRRRARPRRRTPSAPVTSLGVQPAALAHGPAPARAGRGMGRFALAHAPDVRSPAASRLGSQGASGGRLRRRRTFVRLSPTRRSAAALLRGTRSPAEGAEHATIARRGKPAGAGPSGVEPDGLEPSTSCLQSRPMLLRSPAIRQSSGDQRAQAVLGASPQVQRLRAAARCCFHHRFHITRRGRCSTGEGAVGRRLAARPPWFVAGRFVGRCGDARTRHRRCDAG